MACQIRWNGCITFATHERTRIGKQTLKKVICRIAIRGRYYQGCFEKKMVKPSGRREVAEVEHKTRGISIQLACSSFSISEGYYYYQLKLGCDNAAYSRLAS